MAQASCFFRSRSTTAAAAPPIPQSPTRGASSCATGGTSASRTSTSNGTVGGLAATTRRAGANTRAPTCAASYGSIRETRRSTRPLRSTSMTCGAAQPATGLTAVTRPRKTGPIWTTRHSSSPNRGHPSLFQRSRCTRSWRPTRAAIWRGLPDSPASNGRQTGKATCLAARISITGRVPHRARRLGS